MHRSQDLLLSRVQAIHAENVSAGSDVKRQGGNLVEVCLRRKATVLVSLGVCLTAAILYLSLATRIFTCTSRLYVEQNGPQLLGQDSQGGVDRSDTYLFRQCQVMRAEPILRQALAQNPAAVMRMYRNVRDPLPELLKNLNVDVGKKDDIITAQLDSPYPVEAAQLLNSIVSCYEEFVSKLTLSTATEELNILQHEKDNQEQLLSDRLKEIVAFKQKNGEMFFMNDKGMNILTQNLATISDQLTQAKLDAIMARVRADHENNLIRANREVQEADQRVQGFEREFELAKQKALAINSAQAEFQKMQLEADRTTKLCDLLDARIKELNVMGNSGSINIQILEVAKPEDYPTQPKKAMTLLAAVVAGLLLGGGLAMATDYLDQRLRAADEAAHLLGVPVLGVIPDERSPNAPDRSRVGCAVDNSPTSPLADAYHAMAMAVAVHLGWPDMTVRTLLVTSPNRGDGKSTTCSNLAIAMASAGRKILVIDADLRRPVQHEIFGRMNAVGLSDVMSRNTSIDQAIQKTDIEGLSLLACGALPPNPVEIVRGQAFSRILDGLQLQFDLILIDSPPILAAPDARILGAQAGAALLVLRCDRSTRQEADYAAKSLRGVGANLIGVVFNAVKSRRSIYYYENPPRSMVPALSYDG